MSTTKKIDYYQRHSLIRTLYVVERSKYNFIKTNGKTLLNFASNDYLSIANNPKVSMYFANAANKFGLGSSASNIVCGYHYSHKILEEKFAEFLARDDAILFNSGYHANIGVICALANRNSYVISDKLCHASIIDGITISRAKHFRYKHNDINHVSKLIKYPQSIILTEGIFSMEGDIAQAKDLSIIAKTHDSKLIIDEAHSIGILGQNGRGICEYFGLKQEDAPIIIAPLGKAFGSMGAIVAGNKHIIETIRQFARTYIYSTALPPAISYATNEILKIIRKDNWRREKLFELIEYFIEQAHILALPLITKELTPIKSLIIRDNAKAITLKDKLAENGFFISCIRPPTVPIGTARIRISLNCMHEKSQIKLLLETIKRFI